VVFEQWDYVRPEALYDEAVRFMSYEEEHVSSSSSGVTAFVISGDMMCAVLFCVMLCCAEVYCVVLCCAVLCSAV
jgi:hypothetical protein